MINSSPHVPIIFLVNLSQYANCYFVIKVFALVKICFILRCPVFSRTHVPTDIDVLRCFVFSRTHVPSNSDVDLVLTSQS